MKLASLGITSILMQIISQRVENKELTLLGKEQCIIFIGFIGFLLDMTSYKLLTFSS